MVAIAPDHGGDVVFGPILEKAVVILPVVLFRLVPLIECLVDDEQSEAIACIEKRR